MQGPKKQEEYNQNLEHEYQSGFMCKIALNPSAKGFLVILEYFLFIIPPRVVARWCSG